MTHDEIIRAARQAGFPINRHLSGRQDIAGQSVSRFTRFAKLVAQAERERCCIIVYGQCGSDNVAHRTVQAILGKEQDERSPAI